MRLRRLRRPSCFAIDRAMPMRKDAAQGARLGDSSTVEQRTLTPSILVRIQVPQPNLNDLNAMGRPNCDVGRHGIASTTELRARPHGYVTKPMRAIACVTGPRDTSARFSLEAIDAAASRGERPETSRHGGMRQAPLAVSIYSCSDDLISGPSPSGAGRRSCIQERTVRCLPTCHMNP
jgi:hypothetical protein